MPAAGVNSSDPGYTTVHIGRLSRCDDVALTGYREVHDLDASDAMMLAPPFPLRPGPIPDEPKRMKRAAATTPAKPFHPGSRP
jgi:hypothetical protein